MESVICKEYSPQINKMLVEYALEKGIPVFPNTKQDMGYPQTDFMYIAYVANPDHNIIRVAPFHEGKQLSVGEFLTFIDQIAKPKVMLAGHVVYFHNDHVKVGCYHLPHDEVRNFIKEYQNQFGKKYHK